MDNQKRKLKTSEAKKLNELHSQNKNIPNYLKKIAYSFNKSFLSLELRDLTHEHVKKYQCSLFLKSVEKSIKYRESGNALYQQMKYAEALDDYNTALFYAPFNPQKPFEAENVDFVYCLANRSATFLKLKHYVYSLLDIELAVRLNYPKNKNDKIRIRKAACLEGMKTCGKNEIEIHFNEERCEIERSLINNTFVTEQAVVIASRDLKPGDIVFEEFPLNWSLNRELYRERCFHCLEIVETYSFPCYYCNQIRYCTKECSELSWNEGHFFECNSFEILNNFSSTIKPESIRLAIKLLIKLDLHRTFTELREKTVEAEGFTNDKLELIRKIYPNGRVIDIFNAKRQPRNYIKIDDSIIQYEEPNHESALELLQKKINVKNDRKRQRERKNNVDYYQDIIKDCLERPIISTEHELEYVFQNFKRYITDFDPKVEFTDADITNLAQIVIFLINSCDIPKKLLLEKYTLADVELFGSILILLTSLNETNLFDIIQRDIQILNTPNSNHSVIYKEIEHKKIGKGLFPLLNKLKHHCEPNCQIVNFEGPKIIVSCLTDIKEGQPLTLNRLGEFDHTLDVDSYAKHKERYLSSIKRFAYNCIKCKQGHMSILKGYNYKLVDCTKCHFFYKIKDIPNADNTNYLGKPITSEDENIVETIEKILLTESKHQKKLKNIKLLLMKRHPDFITIENALLSAYRDFKDFFCKNNEFLAKLKFDLAFCYMQMKNYKKSIDFAMSAFNTWKLLKRTQNIEYFFGLIKIIDIQYYYILHYDKVQRELDIEDKLTFNFHTENIQTNLEFFLFNKDRYFSDKVIKRKIVQKFNERLDKIRKVSKK